MAALWMPMKPLPSWRTNDNRSAFCESSMSRLPSVEKTTGLEALRVAAGEKSRGMEGSEVVSASVQRLFGNGGAVGPKKSVPALRASPEVVEGDHRGGDRVVLIAFALPNAQEPPLLLLLYPAILIS